MKSELLILMKSPVKHVINGDFIKYIISIKNIGSFNLSNVILRDILSPDLKFVEGSIYFGNEKKEELNITSGINLETINIGEEKQISFKVKIVAKKSMIIGNCAVVEYNFFEKNSCLPIFASASSNINEIFVSIVDINLEEKRNKKIAMIDDEIIYCSMIENCGDLDITNVKLKQKLPKNTELVEDSFMLNGLMLNSVNLESGVNIGRIKSKSSKLIRFKLKIKDSMLDNIDLNEKSLEFNYILPDLTSYRKKIVFVEQNEKLKIKPANFSDLNLDYYLTIPNIYPELKEINSVNVEIDILNNRIIKNSENIAIDSTKRTGCKMILNCMAKYHVQYVGADCEESTQSISYQVPFTTYVIISKSFKSKCKFDIDIDVENIYTHIINSRDFFISTTLLIIVN